MFVALGEAKAKAAPFAGDTLLIPSVSAGSVPQLAVDALVSAGMRLRAMKRVGFWHSDYVVPVAARFVFEGDERDGAEGSITHAVEVFRDAEAKITVVQMRAPVMKNANSLFAKELCCWAAEQQFAEVLFLLSIDDSIRSDAQLAGSQLRVIPIGEGKDGRLQSALLGKVSLLEPELEKEGIRAGSYAYALIAECYANELCGAVFVAFAPPGMNFVLGKALAGVTNEHVLQYVDVEEFAAMAPTSWARMMAESGPAPDLY